MYKLNKLKEGNKLKDNTQDTAVPMVTMKIPLRHSPILADLFNFPNEHHLHVSGQY